MKNFDSAKIAAHASIIFVLCLALYMYFTKDERAAKLNHEIEMLKDNCDFAIGTATGTSQYRNGVLEDYIFEFQYMNKEYNRRWQTPAVTKVISPDFSYYPDFVRGMQYLVLVDKSNPEKSKICFDKPISDSIDFKRYVKEFIQNRKQ